MESTSNLRLTLFNRKEKLNYTICTLLLVMGIATPLWAQLPPISHLSTIQTAEPVGKGGSSTTFGLFQYSKVDLLPDLSQKVDIGGFEETHRVTFQIETFLVPVRFSYGLSDELDLVLGGTFSTGACGKSSTISIILPLKPATTQTSTAVSMNNRCSTVSSDSNTISNRIGTIISPAFLSVATRSSGSLPMIGSIRTRNSSTTVLPMGFRFSESIPISLAPKDLETSLNSTPVSASS